MLQFEPPTLGWLVSATKRQTINFPIRGVCGRIFFFVLKLFFLRRRREGKGESRRDIRME